MDCPVQWSLATPSALESQSRANHRSVVANPICKCRCHSPLGFPHRTPKCSIMYLVDVSIFFFFLFLLGEADGESEAPGGGEVRFFIENPRRGGLRQRKFLWVRRGCQASQRKRLRFGYGFESCDANGPRNVKNTNLAKHRPVFLPPLLLVGSKELVLKVPRRGQFHAAIRVTIWRCDSCAQGALGRRTVSRRNFCDAESLAKRCGETRH